ncbi:MAG: nucleoside triphosphate pyrophosphohydrolase, partial [Proteobacteria bacterium]|nr:nucleoside triphosphate pyrophosphohydrolase [Pseudomonadota bacterium]
MPYNEEATLRAFSEVLKTVHRLRAPGGCPWDREQTHQSLRKFLIEETYEVTDVLDRIDSPESLNDADLASAFCEEWGDLLLQILLHAEIATETRPELAFEAIAKTLNKKLIHRHPHVFGETTVAGTEEVLKNWDVLKKQEKGPSKQEESVFDSIPKSLPPLPRTEKIIHKVTKVGFQWPDLTGPLEKLEEEIRELKEALSETKPDGQKIESEIGDVLFSVANIAYLTKIDAESALRSTLRKFESRFRHVENRLREKGTEPSKST